MQCMLARYSCPNLCPSICCLSVRPSVTRVPCDKTKQCTADILIPHGRAITVVFWHQQWLVGDALSVWNLHSKLPTPFEKRRLGQVSAYNVWTVWDSKKVQLGLWQIGSRPRAFQRAIDGARTLPSSLHRVAQKRIFKQNSISFK